MEERKLTEGIFKKTNKPARIAIWISIVLFVVLYIISGLVEHVFVPWIVLFDDESPMIIWYFLGIPLIILAFVFKWWMGSCELTVTNKRVFGKAGFGKRVDLPMDMISSVGSGIFDNVSVATSSGRISFWFIDNKEEVYNVLSDVLLNRQERTTHTVSHQEANPSITDELKKYKELLDSGIITQEEFDAKKRQLLGL